MVAVAQLAADVGTRPACEALGISRASYYRDRRAASFPATAALHPSPARVLRPMEREMVPPYQKPELLATAPNQLWSWDITKLLGPAKWTYFYLYVILDVFSRYVIGWMVAMREIAELAKRLIEESCEKQKIRPGQLTLHADRDTSMSSKPVAFLLAQSGSMYHQLDGDERFIPLHISKRDLPQSAKYVELDK
jgi:transposase InsO family protein